MAPPAPKRRKLEHSDESDGGNESEGSFAASDSLNDADSDDEASDSDVSMNEPVEQLPAKNNSNGRDPQKSAAQKISSDSRQNKSLGAGLQDGVYTAETFKSNMFKLQVDELLDQVKPKYGKKEAPAENAMRTMKNIIEQLPNRGPLSIIEAEKTLKSEGVTIPFPNPRPPKDAMYKLQYDRPASINATGSYAHRTATKSDSNLAIDFVITMPKSLFQEKDYLNHRYFYKRAFYLACLAAGIKDSKVHAFKLSFDYLNGNQLQPILVVLPNGNGDSDDFLSSKCEIHIVLALPEDTFALGKLLPTSNCVRPKDGEDATPNKSLSPTPFYNSTLLSDANVTAYLKLFHSTASKCVAYKDACILGRVWLKQRGFGSQLRKGGFGNFEWAALIALLLLSNPGACITPLSPGYSSYQLFKATLQVLARHDLSKKPFAVQAPNITLPKVDTTPVFFDGPRGVNVLFKMTSWSYSRLRSEAKTTVDMLSESAFDQFDSTFILKTELLRLKYDAVLEIPVSAFGVDSASEEPDRTLQAICQNIYDILTRALTDRVDLITFTLPEEHNWPITSCRPLEKQQKKVIISFVTNPSNANRTIDHGPSAEEKQKAAAFRKFWGEKSELRRFKDGSILESVVWPPNNSSASVVEQIVLYILKQHLGASLVEQAKFSSDDFAHLIPFGRIQGQSGVAAFLPIMNAFAAVEKDIRELEELPLQIRHIRAADPQLRYSSIELPIAGHDPASVILQFEGSGRWPDDLCAIQRTKIAFLLKLSELLGTVQPTYATRVGLENPSSPAQNQAYLDITVPPGFTFRIRIHHDREATLLERQLKDTTLDAQSRESAAASLAQYKREFVQTPSHTQALQTLCTRFPALSPSIRLLKKWFASHLLSPHFASELIEFLVIRTFLDPHPWTSPSCATTGFLRTIAWLSRWDWRHTPMIVDFSTSCANDLVQAEDTTSKHMRLEDIERIQTRFEAWRRIDPAMNRLALFIATNLDEEGNTWTDKGRPQKVIAARLTALAKAAAQAVRTDEDDFVARANGNVEARKKESLNLESLFVPRPEDFDIVIQMNYKYASRSSKKQKSSDAKFKNLEIQQLSSAPQQPSDSLPILYAQELHEIYGDAILWFWDPEAMDQIVGLWNPVVTAQRSWKVKVGWNSVPLAVKKKGKEETEVDVTMNKAAVVHEIRRLGGDLVKSVIVNR